jgi:hypothetical protein
METLAFSPKVRAFLATGDGYGDGSGYGSGYGSGSGSGYGSGYGSGSGDGDGSGYGSGSGDGSGYGSGYGDGDGSGYGSGYGIPRFNGECIHMVDDVQTIIKSVRGNVAKGFILQADLTLKPCFIAKANDFFAHGDTIQQARTGAETKAFEEMDEDARISAFRERFSADGKHLGSDLFEWHGKLTGSCLMGREQFVRDRQIDLTKTFTITEFIELCKGAYGGEIVARLLA